jgi:SAM-dependent methyltransferase
MIYMAIMGSINQLLFIQRHVAELAGPFLEAGAKDYGDTQDLRTVFRGRGEYLGADIESGPGVDVVLDFTRPFAEVDGLLGGRRFGTIFCLSVMEHCVQPFVMAENLTRLLLPGGKLCIAVPFAYRFHSYPSDYWRFTYEGVKILFPRLHFDPRAGTAATSRTGEFKPLDEELGLISFGAKWHRRKGHFLRGVAAKTLSWLGRIGILRWLAGYDYVLSPTEVMMIGTLPDGKKTGEH